MRKVEKKEEKRQLEDAFALWKKEGKNQVYYTGKDCNGNNITAFVNYNKQNEKQPDIKVYNQNSEGKVKDEVCALWNKESKDKKTTYLTGQTSDKEYIVAFFNLDAPSNQPTIRAYFQENENK